MNTHVDTQNPQLSHSEASSAAAQPNVFSDWWQRVWNRFAEAVVQSQELVVTQECDKQGDFWRIYDPNSNLSVELRSEQEALIWLEQHAHQTPKASHDYFSRTY